MWKKLVHRASANTGMVPDFKSSQNEKKKTIQTDKNKNGKRREERLHSVLSVKLLLLNYWAGWM
jgi:hypothetical protein